MQKQCSVIVDPFVNSCNVNNGHDVKYQIELKYWCYIFEFYGNVFRNFFFTSYIFVSAMKSIWTHEIYSGIKELNFGFDYIKMTVLCR